MFIDFTAFARPVTLVCFALMACQLASAQQEDVTAEPRTIRVATYNVSLYAEKYGEVAKRLAEGGNEQAESLAAVIQTVRPDILLLNEVDYDAEGTVAKLFAEKYLAVAQGERRPLNYPYIYFAPTNTGILSGMDLDRNGKTDDPVDAWGYGVYEGQYGMAVLSRFPIAVEEIRTFQEFRWKDFPDVKRPMHPTTGNSYYSDESWDKLRLSSKNHIDVPIDIAGSRVHLLASHPTPPAFDGPEDHNGCRNHDEIKFWEHYISSSTSSDDASWIVDDRGRAGGIVDDALFVIAGDLNSDPVAGSSQRDAIVSLLGHAKVQDTEPRWMGQPEPAKLHTALFGRGNETRVDYVLPSSQFTITESGVFWPDPLSPDAKLITATDHRLVWVEVTLP